MITKKIASDDIFNGEAYLKLQGKGYFYYWSNKVITKKQIEKYKDFIANRADFTELSKSLKYIDKIEDIVYSLIQKIELLEKIQSKNKEVEEVLKLMPSYFIDMRTRINIMQDAIAESLMLISDEL